MNKKYRNLMKLNRSYRKGGSRGLIKDFLMSVLGFILAVIIIVVLYYVFKDSINSWVSEWWSKFRF
ncbi:MAG TPA: hypothetical protein GX708_04345 [Gallicola sp.]|nr:hypothetical protein [Gallicola sp.]